MSVGQHKLSFLYARASVRRGQKTQQRKHLKENSESGCASLNSLSIFYSAFFYAQCTDRKDWGETPFPALWTAQKQDLDAKHHGVCIRQLALKIVRVSWAYLLAGRTAAAHAHWCFLLLDLHRGSYLLLSWWEVLAYLRGQVGLSDPYSVQAWGKHGLSCELLCWLRKYFNPLFFRWTSYCRQSDLHIEFSRTSLTLGFDPNYLCFPCSARGQDKPPKAYELHLCLVVKTEAYS